ncbi:mariner mos1 transposase-like protein [Holotrichia oblita]|uniref:Mariner mos1 transposase-like protein n=1 Tax=Holotrichia oblita TaxID=644536 RepID=A0ACB9TG06_HOLOL|nr:mariner mos1 transposase-like protein [Holotrichia oblita]
MSRSRKRNKKKHSDSSTSSSSTSPCSSPTPPSRHERKAKKRSYTPPLTNKIRSTAVSDPSNYAVQTTVIPEFDPIKHYITEWIDILIILRNHTRGMNLLLSFTHWLVRMRIENRIHIRYIMLYHFEKSWSATQSFRDLNDLFGEEIISKSQVERWFKNFKSDDTNLADEEGRGRPSNFNDQALLAAVEEDESLTTRMLAGDFNVHSTIVCRLKKLGKVWKLAGWVLHKLAYNYIAERFRNNLIDLSKLSSNAAFEFLDEIPSDTGSVTSSAPSDDDLLDEELLDDE